MTDEYITFEFYMYNWTPIIIVGVLSIGMISYFISSTRYYKRKNYKKVALVNTKNI